MADKDPSGPPPEPLIKERGGHVTPSVPMGKLPKVPGGPGPGSALQASNQAETGTDK